MNHLVSVYSFNQINPNIENGSIFAARPLKHWRKQLYNNGNGSSINRRTNLGIPTDRPGGIIPVASNQINCCVCSCKGAVNIKETPLIYTSSLCDGCRPLKPTTQLKEKVFTDSETYLRSRCLTYDQHITTIPADGINYFSENGRLLDYTNAMIGPQLRNTNNCPASLTNKTPCATTIYKHNNSAYAQQGGVSSSSRMARLKYNISNNNGAAYLSAAGATNVNSGRYQNEPSPSYPVKYKPYQCTTLPRKNGAKTYCSTEYNMSMQE